MHVIDQYNIVVHGFLKVKGKIKEIELLRKWNFTVTMRNTAGLRRFWFESGALSYDNVSQFDAKI